MARLSIILVLCMFFALPVFAETDIIIEPEIPMEEGYIDVPDAHWAAQAIRDLSEVRIMDGFRDYTFRPERIVTRAELAVLLVRVKGYHVSLGEELFKDVSPHSWSGPYISEVIKRGYMIGYPNETFRPSLKVTRAEAAVTLARAFDFINVTTAKRPFPDVFEGHWAFDAIARGRAMGIYKYLEEDNFKMDEALTRAEIAEILSRLAPVREMIARKNRIQD